MKSDQCYYALVGIGDTPPHVTASQDRQAPTYLTERRKIETVRWEVVITTLLCMLYGRILHRRWQWYS